MVRPTEHQFVKDKISYIIEVKEVLSFQISELSKQIKGTLVSLSSLAAISDQEKIRKVTIIVKRGTLLGVHISVFLKYFWVVV